MITRTLILLFIVALSLSGAANAQERVDSAVLGDWTGAIRIQGVELGIQVHFRKKGATIDIVQQGAVGLPLKQVVSNADSIHFELPAGPGLAVFNGLRSDEKISGSFEQAGITGTFSLKRFQASGNDDSEITGGDVPEMAMPGELVIVETTGGNLAGTLLVPDGAGPHPLVILVAGSGPTDRNGNSVGLPGKNNSLRLLAEALKTEGIATLRYDKRGIGESLVRVDESALRVDSFAGDVVRWLRSVEDDNRFSHVFLAGHSEGSLLVSIAASRVEVDGVISIAGAGRPATEVLREQLASQLPEERMEEVDSIMAALTRGETVDEIPAELVALFRPSIQPYLSSWFSFDPAKVLRDVSVPKLIVLGETDIQISRRDADRLAKYSPDAFLYLIPGMNHVLKDVPSDRTAQLASYSNPKLPVHPDLVREIARFVDDVSSSRR